MGPAKTLRHSGVESGNVLLAFLLATPMLLGFLAFGVDAVRCLTVKSLQADALQAAFGVQKSSTTSLLAKNSENPGMEMAQATIGALRKQGYDGSVDVWFCEVEHPDETRRLLLFQTDLAERVETSLGPLFGADSVLVESRLPSYAMPYSEFEAWKPRRSDNGRFHCDEGAPASQIDYTPHDLSEMPEEMTGQSVGAT